MNTPRFSTLAARLLKGSLDSISRRPGLDARARSMATLERAFAVERRRRKWQWAFGTASVAIAVALAVLFGYPLLTPQARAPISVNASPRGLGATFKTSEGAAPLQPGAIMSSGGRLETNPGGGALLSLSSGTHLELAGSTVFHVESQGTTERFLLDLGELDARVEKLRDGERFIVETPDAEVEVRGTEFRLRVLGAGELCDGSRTHLHVREGVVEVRASGKVALVGKGENWPKDCASTPPASIASASASPAPTAPLVVSTPSVEATRVAPPSDEARPSALTEQNELFAAALSARRRGDTAAAVHALGTLIARHPSSALAENAMVERMRLLSSNRELQRREATRYLRTYPQGFARDEAKRVGGPD